MEKKQRGTVKKSAAGHGKVVDKGKVFYIMHAIYLIAIHVIICTSTDLRPIFSKYCFSIAYC